MSHLYPGNNICPLIQNNLKLVFVDVKIDTLNLDEDTLEKAISKRTKAIFVANILGLSCNFNKINEICKKYKLILMVDNCESLLSLYDGKISASYGVFATLSSFFSHHFSTIEGVIFLQMISICIVSPLIKVSWMDKRATKNSKFLSSKYSEFEKSYKFVYGCNLRPTEINAVIGLEQIKKLKFYKIKERKR